MAEKPVIPNKSAGDLGQSLDSALYGPNGLSMADVPEIEFGTHPLEWLAKPKSASKVLLRYLASPAAGYDRLHSKSDPNQISAIDIVRVGLLGPGFPASSANWLLSDEGRWLTAELLADIPTYLELRTPHPNAIFRCSDLLHLLRSNGSKWPPSKGPALHRKEAIQLLAAKRPALVPIDDKIMRRALEAPKDDDWWKRWRYVMTADTVEQASKIRSLAAKSDAFAEELPILRVIEIVIRGRYLS